MPDTFNKKFSLVNSAKDIDSRVFDHVQLIACDIDGTLLNAEETVAPHVKELVQAISESGVRFLLITRRHYLDALRFAQMLKLDMPLVALDGAMVQTPGSSEPMHTIGVEGDEAYDLIDELSSVKGLDYAVVTPKHLLVSRKDYMPSSFQFQTLPVKVIENPHQISELADEILEVVATADFQGANKVYSYLENKTGKTDMNLRMHESKTGNIWNLSVRSVKATKLSALELVLKPLHITLRGVLAIGDHFNDVELCKKAGMVATVSNAIKEIKQLADFITERDCFNNGIGDFFELFLDTRGFDVQQLPTVRAMHQAAEAERQRPRSS